MLSPSSDHAAGFDEGIISHRIEEAEAAADQRLAQMKISEQAMAPADTNSYGGELQDMAATQRQIRLLELKQREADLAIKLWSTVNDGKRDGGAGSGNVAHLSLDGVAPAGMVPFQAGDPTRAPLPRVVSIIGVGSDIRATVLIPYEGQTIVTNGQDLPGGLHVAKISTAGVIVTDELGRTFALGFGNRVPATPPGTFAANARSPVASVPGR